MELEPSKNRILIKKANDHWAFLEHTEAPMWADLTLEAKSGGENISDDWFNISHPFHQWSARQLKSKFSHPGEEILTSSVDSQGPASPKLPSSVSRSRGKHYNSKKWAGINLNVLLDKQQGLSRRCFQAGSSFGQKVKPKSKSNVRRPKGSLSAKLGVTLEYNVRGNASCKPVASCRNPVISSSSVDSKTGESNTRSTITSENTQQQQKYMEVSSQPCHQKSESSSVGTVILRKSCAAKRASRVEIGGDSMHSRGRKSSSGKSSVGSCTSNPGYGVKFASKQLREKITDGKDEVTMNLAAKNRCKPANISQTSTIPVEGAKSSNRKGSNITLTKPAYERTEKSGVQYQTIRSRAFLPGKVKKENSCTGGKEKLSKVNSSRGKGKENAARNVEVHQKCTERCVPAGAMLKNHRTAEKNLPHKGDRAGSSALMKQGKDSDQRQAKKDSDQRQAKKPTNVARKIYLR